MALKRAFLVKFSNRDKQPDDVSRMKQNVDVGLKTWSYQFCGGSKKSFIRKM